MIKGNELVPYSEWFNFNRPCVFTVVEAFSTC